MDGPVSLTINGALVATGKGSAVDGGAFAAAAWLASRELERVSEQAGIPVARGVSLDEEMTNLMRYQKAFEASARVITTVDEMLETVLSLKR